MSRLPAAQRREQLLDCAAKLFAERGYARATTAELARSAGVTEPIIYRHFASKRDLFIALIERTGEETLRQWHQELRDAKDAAERLKRLVGENPLVRPRGQAAYRVIIQAITEVDDPSIRAALDAHIGTLHKFITAEIARAQEDHKVNIRFAPDLIAWLLIYIAIGYGVVTAWGITEHGRDAEGMHVASAITRMLVGRESK